jgi:phosphohistidine phosphatase
MHFWAERGYGKSIRGRATPNGRSFRKGEQIVMELYFLRHGEADWPDWKKPDDDRPLTKRGKKEMSEVAKFLNRLKVRPQLIVTSPLPRAAQTAEIAADFLKAKLRKDEALAPGFALSKLQTVLKRHRADILMLVGHEPDFTNVISGLTGASLKLSKAGVALVDVDPEAEEGRLLWLFPPKFARKSK